MLLRIPDVLTPDQIKQARELLDKAEWIDGKVTAGHQAVKVKDNLQIHELNKY
jgi:PKHD-type hydroxylase